MNTSDRQIELRPRILLLLFLLVTQMGTSGAFTPRKTTTLAGRKLYDESCRVCESRRPPTRLWVTNDPERIRKNAGHKKKRPNQVAHDASKRLAELESRYDANPHGSEKPVLNDYLKVIKAWAKSNAKDGAIRAATLLERVEELHNKPGSTYIYGLVDSDYKEGMTAQETRTFVKKAISHAMARDGSSGGVIRTVMVTAEGNDRDYTPGNQLPYGPAGW